MAPKRGIFYDPEQFPAAIVRLKNPRAVVLVFSSGKLVVTGVRDSRHLHLALKRLVGFVSGDSHA